MSTVCLESPLFVMVHAVSTKLELEELRKEVKELKRYLMLARRALAEKEAYGEGLAADLEHAVEMLKVKLHHH